MHAVVVGGYGYAGSRHARILRETGYTVHIVEVRGIDGAKPPEALPKLAETADIVVFADPPGTRIRQYLSNPRVQEALRDKIVVLEKPPCRPHDWRLLASLGLDWVPVHNYLWMEPVREAMKSGEVEVIVLRPGPHKGWYTSIEHAGGGVLLDHGYHWLYVTAAMGMELDSAWIDTYPETEAAFTAGGGRVRAYLSWRSPFRATVLNGRPFEPRSEQMLESLYAFYAAILGRGGGNVRAMLRAQALTVLAWIEEVYERSGLPWRGREGRKDEPRA